MSTRRVYGTTKIASNCTTAPDDSKVGKIVGVLVYKITKVGYIAGVNNKYSGMRYNDQILEHLGLGDRRKAHINQIRDDGKIDLFLKKPDYRSMRASGRKIVAVLKDAGGFILCHDRSAPAQIKKTFALGKKEIKPNEIQLKKKLGDPGKQCCSQYQGNNPE